MKRVTQERYSKTCELKKVFSIENRFHKKASINRISGVTQERYKRKKSKKNFSSKSRIHVKVSQRSYQWGNTRKT